MKWFARPFFPKPVYTFYRLWIEDADGNKIACKSFHIEESDRLSEAKYRIMKRAQELLHDTLCKAGKWPKAGPLDQETMIKDLSGSYQ